MVVVVLVLRTLVLNGLTDVYGWPVFVYLGWYGEAWLGVQWGSIVTSRGVLGCSRGYWLIARRRGIVSRQPDCCMSCQDNT